MSISFSSSTANKGYTHNTFNKVITSIGKVIPEKVNNFCDLSSKGALKRLTFISVAAAFLLGTRYFQARNSDEKREVFTRDFSGVVAAVYAVPILKKFLGIFVNKKTGIPVAHGEGGIKANLNPETGKQIASYKQLEDWFKVKKIADFDKIKGGFKSFCKNIENVGGDLTKCFKVLGEGQLPKALTDIAEGKTVNKNNILEIIENTDEDKLKPLKELFKGKNKLFKKASHFKSLTEATCIGLTAFLLGGLLPWFNIWYTRRLYKNGTDKTTFKNFSDVRGLKLKDIKVNTHKQTMSEKFRLFHDKGKLV